MSKRALIVYGGFPGHTPKESAERFAKLLPEHGFAVELSDSLDAFADDALMGAVDLIIPVWTMGQLENPQWKNINQAVRGGVGFAGFHGGAIDSFRSNTSYQFMTGGQFVAHPGNILPEHRVEITDTEHPITQGIRDFTLVNTERYYMHVDPGVHTLATTTISGDADPDLYPQGVVMPYAWTRMWGQGRVFIAAWGHQHSDFDVPEAEKMVVQGMVWASR